MNYTKPEITSLASASFVIQSGQIKSHSGVDSANQPLATVPAYEGDE
jgi:hypothetical protein